MAALVMSRVDWVDLLVQARKSRGWSARELARRMGLSHSTVAGWEQRRVANLSLESVNGLAKAFGVRDQVMGAYLSGEVGVDQLAREDRPVEADPAYAMFAGADRLSPERRLALAEFLNRLLLEELDEQRGDD